MSSVVIKGDTSGQVTLDAPAVAGTVAVTLPSASGTMATTGDVIGVGQTWQDVTGSRTAGTTYTNSTGKPIQVIVSFQSSNQTNFALGTINGLTVYGSVTTSGSHWGTISYIVPNGNTYSANMNGGSVTATNWLELR